MRKMKKDERHSFIIKRSYELAYSGEGRDWLTIEHILRAEGWEEARSLLDSDFIRKQLNDICNTANSPSEIKNKKDFSNWIKEFIEKNISVLKENYPNINVYTRDNKFSISTSNKEIELSKIFDSRKLSGDYYFVESDGDRYKSVGRYKSEKSFDEFTIEDLYLIVKIVAN